MKSYIFGIGILAILTFTSCGGASSDSDPMQLIAGDETKWWRLKKEVNENGFKEKTTPVEKQQVIAFDTGHSFTTSILGETRAGTWEYNGKTLTLQYYDNGELITYEVQDLQENKMRWKAADKSELVLTTK